MLPRLTKIVRRPTLSFIVILVVYSLLLLPTINRQGISWDEQVDIWVARSYLKRPDGLLAGSVLDPSQTRLPAFTVALVYMLVNNSSLTLARTISWGVAALTLLAVFIYGKRRYGTREGLLASALLATSPFFLSFARVAFTETDIYLACTLAWLLVGVDQFQDQPSIRRAMLVGVLVGLCLSAKFTAVSILPAVWYAVWQTRKHNQGIDLSTANPITISLGILAMIGLLLGGWYISNKISPEIYRGTIRFFHYLVVFCGWLLALAWAFRRLRSTSSWLLLGLWITALAGLTFLVVPPEHLTNPDILRSLSDRFQHEMTYRIGFMFEAAALHILSIFIKSSLVIGAGLLVSLVLATLQVRNWRIQFPVLVVWLYFGALVVLPLAQTFYTIPLLPFLAIFTADQFFLLFSRQRIVAIGLAALAVVMLGVDLVLCYPDYNLNGYQWLGKYMLAGRPSIGYRSVVQTPSDGVEQAMEWLNDHAGTGDRVRTYLLSWHIVQAVAPSPAYTLENGFQGQGSAQPDYVVVEINAQIRQSWWIQSPPGDVFRPLYDPVWLESNYTQVFTVKRAFGIEMASVYKRK